jgi:hypothetical protein
MRSFFIVVILMMSSAFAENGVKTAGARQKWTSKCDKLLVTITTKNPQSFLASQFSKRKVRVDGLPRKGVVGIFAVINSNLVDKKNGSQWLVTELIRARWMGNASPSRNKLEVEILGHTKEADPLHQKAVVFIQGDADTVRKIIALESADESPFIYWYGDHIGLIN